MNKLLSVIVLWGLLSGLSFGGLEWLTIQTGAVKVMGIGLPVAVMLCGLVCAKIMVASNSKNVSDYKRPCPREIMRRAGYSEEQIEQRMVALRNYNPAENLAGYGSSGNGGHHGIGVCPPGKGLWEQMEQDKQWADAYYTERFLTDHTTDQPAYTPRREERAPEIEPQPEWSRQAEEVAARHGAKW